MKKYIKDALKELDSSEKTKIELKLKSPDDFKRNVARLLYNKLILTLQQKMVPSHIKNLLLRTTGMDVGHDACIPHDIYMDHHFPELISLKKGCIVGGESSLYTHIVKGKKLILGKVTVEERTLLGGMCKCLPGFKLNKNSMVNFFSDCDKEIPEGELWGGRPAKLMMKMDKESVDKFFKPSNMKYKEYYKDFKKQVNEFMKDPNKNYLKIYYNGKRLNAGNDWWRARNVLRTFYNGVIIEITRKLSHSWFKTMLLRMAGVNIGKNVKIAKGVVFDHLFCDTITVEDNVTLDDHCYLDGHEYTITQTVFGKIIIKKGVHIKHHSYVRTGTTIGENTIVEPNSFCQREIPANVVWGGKAPGKIIRKLK